MKCVIFVRNETESSGVEKNDDKNLKSKIHYNELGMVEIPFREIILKGEISETSISVKSEWYNLVNTVSDPKLTDRIDGRIQLNLSLIFSNEDIDSLNKFIVSNKPDDKTEVKRSESIKGCLEQLQKKLQDDESIIPTKVSDPSKSIINNDDKIITDTSGKKTIKDVTNSEESKDNKSNKETINKENKTDDHSKGKFIDDVENNDSKKDEITFEATNEKNMKQKQNDSESIKPLPVKKLNIADEKFITNTNEINPVNEFEDEDIEIDSNSNAKVNQKDDGNNISLKNQKKLSNIKDIKDYIESDPIDENVSEESEKRNPPISNKEHDNKNKQHPNIMLTPSASKEKLKPTKMGKTGLKVRDVAKDHFSSGVVSNNLDYSGFNLVIRFLNGESLLASDVETGKSDPICFIWCGSSQEEPPPLDKLDEESKKVEDCRVLTTNVCYTTTDPIWNENIIYPLDVHDIDTLANLVVKVYVRDEDIIGETNNGDVQRIFDELGMVDIYLKDIITTGKVLKSENSIVKNATWYDLKKSPGMRRIDGRIKFSLSLIFPDAKEEYENCSIPKCLQYFQGKSNESDASASKSSKARYTPRSDSTSPIRKMAGRVNLDAIKSIDNTAMISKMNRRPSTGSQDKKNDQNNETSVKENILNRPKSAPPIKSNSNSKPLAIIEEDFVVENDLKKKNDSFIDNKPTRPKSAPPAKSNSNSLSAIDEDVDAEKYSDQNEEFFSEGPDRGDEGFNEMFSRASDTIKGISKKAMDGISKIGSSLPIGNKKSSKEAKEISNSNEFSDEGIHN